MGRLFNLLILLTIVSFGRFNLSSGSDVIGASKPVQPLKGPVYNPLRAKPYARSTAKV